MNRIYRPLAADHPLVTDGTICPVCKRGFDAGERTTLLCAAAERPSTVQAVPVHATCAVRGVRTRVGEIARIKDGDGSPFPVLTTDGKQWHFAEAGLEGQ